MLLKASDSRASPGNLGDDAGADGNRRRGQQRPAGQCLDLAIGEASYASVGGSRSHAEPVTVSPSGTTVVRVAGNEPDAVDCNV